MKLPPFLQFSTSANDWRNDVELLAKGNTATVCLFTEPDPALRERFDGSAECTQEGHSLNGHATANWIPKARARTHPGPTPGPTPGPAKESAQRRLPQSINVEIRTWLEKRVLYALWGKPL